MNESQCSCGATFPPVPAGGGAAGYAVTPEGQHICYACADKRTLEDLKDRSKPFVGYLSGSSVTTWTGGKLMTVVRSASCQLTRFSYTHNRNSYRSVRCVDVHGNHWAGRGSDGIAIKLRPVKK